MSHIEIKTVGEEYGACEVVYLDGEKQRSFSHVSDDYAITNAREFANKLRQEIKDNDQRTR